MDEEYRKKVPPLVPEESQQKRWSLDLLKMGINLFASKNPTNNIVIRLNILIKTEYFSLSYFIMSRKERIKHCDRCSTEFSTLYRVRYLADKKWYFLCKNCVDVEKPKNDHYQYGGTWKK